MHYNDIKMIHNHYYIIDIVAVAIIVNDTNQLKASFC